MISGNFIHTTLKHLWVGGKSIELILRCSTDTTVQQIQLFINQLFQLSSHLGVVGTPPRENQLY